MSDFKIDQNLIIDVKCRINDSPSVLFPPHAHPKEVNKTLKTADELTGSLQLHFLSFCARKRSAHWLPDVYFLYKRSFIDLFGKSNSLMGYT